MNNVKIANDMGSEVIQFSVLLDNKVGSVLNFIKFLQSNGITILAMDVVDNSQTGVLRFIANYQHDLEKLLEKNKISFKKTDVVCVEMTRIEQLNQILQSFFEAEVSFHYFYIFFVTCNNNVAVVFSTENNQLCKKIINTIGIKLLSTSDISR